ncbi:MAG: hypothetical protein A2X83_06270 [Desulfuromonadales bacterium GWD2_54_10]|nr:MAG: hypothetical protein A2X83_06270 [Desulfuromonadales bacterium GWD2_54_10]
MEIPSFEECMLPLLRYAADGQQHSTKDAVDSIADQLQLSSEQRIQLHKSGTNILYANAAWAKTYLKEAKLLEYPLRGMLRITDEGKRVIESNVQHIDAKFLERFPSFAEFLKRKGTRTTADAQMEAIPDTSNYTKTASEFHSGGMNMPNTVKETIENILDLQLEWSADTTVEMKERGELVRNKFPQLLETLLRDYLTTIPNIGFEGSDGTGRKNRVPWARIFSNKYSPKATDGWCVAILFAFDGSEAYVSLGLGSTQGKSFLPKDPDEIAEKVNWARSVQIKSYSNIEGLLETIQLKDPGNLGASYEKSNVYAIKYRRDAIPEDEQIKSDIAQFLCMLSDLYQAEESLVPTSAQQALETPKEDRQIWVFAPGRKARFWNDCYSGSIAVFGAERLGPLNTYISKEEIQQKLKDVYQKNTDTEPSNDALAAWEFSRVMKAGDIVFAKNGKCKIVGIGVVIGGYRHDPNRIEYRNVRDVKWIREGEWLLPDGVKFANKTLTNITRNRSLVDIIGGVIGIKYEDILEEASVENIDVPVITDESEPDIQPEYSIEDCSHETGLDEETLERWVRAIERKGQAILYGPPGTGKTYVARRLAKHLVCGNDGFVELIQFHPTYAYEDFIQGIRPMTGEDGGLSYPLVPGRFLEFCKKAERREGRCVLILDEINRANLSRVFGELMYLLEYRDHSIPLAGGERFGIPENVRLIGTMNTADRSIALVDHALRRRFAFLELYPNYEVLERFHSDNEFPVTGLVETLKSVNRQIGDRHYMVGISFFLRNDLVDQIEDIWRMEIEPYLEEYFFDQPAKVDEFRWTKVKGTVART